MFILTLTIFEALSSRFDGGGKQAWIQLSFYTYCENSGQVEERL